MIDKAGFAVGVDLDLPAMLAHKGLSAKVYADLRAIPLCDQTFNVITANMVVEHLDDPEQVFREVFRLLRPNGIFVFHTTNADNPFIRLAAQIPQGLKNNLVYVLENRKARTSFLPITRSIGQRKWNPLQIVPAFKSYRSILSAPRRSPS